MCVYRPVRNFVLPVPANNEEGSQNDVRLRRGVHIKQSGAISIAINLHSTSDMWLNMMRSDVQF